jgi:two-component system, OmpR family, response regulator RegX3
VAQLLVVEDDERIRMALIRALRDRGHAVSSVGTALAGLQQAVAERPDLVVLDLGLPDLDGGELLRMLRAVSAVPVIVATARDDDGSVVAALDAGADDYVVKPFSSAQLDARIRAVLRRGGESEELLPQVLEAGPVRMDVERHVVTVDGGEVSLPLKEFDLLEYLLRNVGRVLTRGQLIDRVWGADYVGDTKTLDVHVKRLRSKIEPDPSAPRHLVTVRGLGYKFES